MMREIKFRAWDKKNKKWHEGWRDLFPWGTRPPRSDIIILDIMPMHFQFEQYSGLKDKNDKEIYEGDVINCKDKEQARAEISGEIEMVIWSDFHLCYCTRKPNKHYEHTEYELYLCCWEEIEVIGNIHENPELLNENQPPNNQDAGSD